MINKKAEMGVGTLIVFIAMLLVAAVAAGVLIQTAGSLQEKSLSTGQQARSQISTNARVIEVSATDGRNGNLTDFQEIIKLSPGSDPIKLTQIIFTFNTKDRTSTLKYRTDGICIKNNTNGYNTWNPEEIGFVNSSTNYYRLEEDLDDDGYDDFMYVNDTGALEYVFNISNELNWITWVVSDGSNITNASGTPVDITMSGTIRNGSGLGDVVLGYIDVDGYTYTNDSITVNTSVIITPYNDGEGYFAAIYEQEGTNHVPGNLQRGDIIRFCFEAPGQITEDEEVRLNFIPKIGTPTLTQFVTPDVISTERVYLYP